MPQRISFPSFSGVIDATQEVIASQSPTTVGAIIEGAPGQSSDLQQWQNSSGTTLTSIRNDGALISTVGASFGNTVTLANSGLTWAGFSSLSRNSSTGAMTWALQNNSGAGLNIVNGNIGTVPITVKGVASQTADLQQWQNSSGTTLLSVQANGTLNSIGPIQTSSNISAAIFMGSLVDNAQTGSYLVPSTTNMVLNTRSATNIGLIVKGAASQSADLQQWQNSAGSVLAKVDFNGSIFTSNISSPGGGSLLSVGNTLLFIAGAPSLTPLAVKGAASQSADLQQWQNSSATVLASMSSAGNLMTQNQTVQGTIGDGTSAGAYISFAGANVTVNTRAAANLGLIVKGTASQSVDLQQWQDSTAAVKAAINSSGQLKIGGGSYNGAYTIDCPSGQASIGSIAIGVGGGSKIWHGGSNARMLSFGGPAGQAVQLGSPDAIGFLINGSATASMVLDASGNIVQSAGLFEGTLMAAPTSPAVAALTSGGSLALSTTYYWVVTALDPFGGETVQTSQVTATTAGSGTNQTAPLSWTASPGAMGYNIYRSTTSGNFTNATRYTVINVVTFNDTGAAGTTATPPAATAAYTRKISSLSGTPNFIANTATASANYGLLSIGSGPFDGVSSGKFTGVAGGVLLAINAPVGYNGHPINIQNTGISCFRTDTNGTVWCNVTNAAPGVVGLIVTGASGQNGDLQRWNDNTSTTYARVGSPGNSANYGIFSVGTASWDGAAAGHFVGSSNGTQIAANAPSGYTGNLIDLQLAGTSRFNVASDGTVSQAGGNGIQTSQVRSAGTMVIGLSANTSSTGTIVNLTGIGGSAITSSSAIQSFVGVTPTINQSGTAGYTALLVNPGETATGSGTKLLADLQRGGISQVKVDRAGYLTTTGGISITPAVLPGSFASAAGAGGPGGNLAANTTYWYGLTVVDYDGKEAKATTVSFAEGATPTQVNLSWAAAASTVQFINVYKGATNTQAGLFFLAQVAGNATAYVDTGNTATTGQTPPADSQNGNVTIQMPGGLNTGLAPTTLQILDSNGGQQLMFGSVNVNGANGVAMACPSGQRMHLIFGSPGLYMTGLQNTNTLVLTNPSSGTMALAAGTASTLQLQSGPAAGVTVPTTSAASSGTFIPFTISPTMTQTSTAGYTALLVNATETSTGSGTKRLLDLQLASTSKFSVDNAGNISNSGNFTVGNQFSATSGAVTLTVTAISTANPASPALTVKAAASQTTDLQQWQNSSTTVLSSVDKAGRFASVNVEAVTAVAGANAGTSPPSPVVTGSTDVRGLITWGTGTGPAAGAQVAVTFPTAWANAPYIAVTPINSATAALLPYVAAATTTGFTISLQAAPAASQGNTIYGVQFHALG